MAYARHNSGQPPFGRKRDKSDVYIIGTSTTLQCLTCWLRPEGAWFGIFNTSSRTEMLKHLQEHRQVGQSVPWYATRRLKREIRQIGDTY